MNSRQLLDNLPPNEVHELRWLTCCAQKEDTAELLSFIADGLRKGSFVLKAGGEIWSSSVSPLLALIVHFKQKPKGARKVVEQLNIKLEWQRHKRSDVSVSAKTDTRCKLFLQTLKSNPEGMRLQELERELNIPMGCLSWPIHKLIKEGLIVRVGKRYKIAKAIPST